MGLLRIWFWKWFYGRLLTRDLRKPTYIGNSVLLLSNDLEDGNREFFLTATAKHFNIAIPVNEEIVRFMINSISEQMELDFVEFTDPAEKKEKRKSPI